MAMKVRYKTVNGRIISQNKGGVYTRLLSDPLGNVIATMDASGVKTNDTTYWPYGEVRTGGVSTVTSLGFCGAWGYYTDASARLYVRARYYRPVLGRWQTVDPLWPEGAKYGYSRWAPVVYVDASGLLVIGSPSCGARVDKCCNKLRSMIRDAHSLAAFRACMRSKGHTIGVDMMLDLLNKACFGLDFKRFCFFCYGDDVPGCRGKDPCGPPSASARMLCSKLKDEFPIMPPHAGCDTIARDFCPGACGPGTTCDCTMVACFDFNYEDMFCGNLFHELAHCFGPGHKAPPDQSPNDFVRAIGHCYCLAVYGESCKYK